MKDFLIEVGKFGFMIVDAGLSLWYVVTGTKRLVERIKEMLK